VLRVRTKSDLDLSAHSTDADIAISSKCGAGLDQLLALVLEAVRRRLDPSDGDPASAALITQVRHRAQLEAARSAIDDFLAGPIHEADLRAEDLRQAALSMGRLTGRIDAEDVLGEIFGRFCIGK
jgi:tRNA modification GTPase